MKMKNKKAFITGSGRGIGREMALELARRGCDILLHYRKDEASISATRDEIKKSGVKTWVYQADLCDATQTAAMVKTIQVEHDSLDIFIANAASTSFKSLLDLNQNNIDKTFCLVIKSFLLVVQGLKNQLAKTQGQILTISGIDTVKYCPGHGLLAAAKAALEVLSKYLAVELAGDKIVVKSFNPGLVATDSTRFYLGEAFDEIFKQTQGLAPGGGFASAAHVAKLAVMLLSPECRWMTASTVYADGGLGFMLPSVTQPNKS